MAKTGLGKSLSRNGTRHVSGRKKAGPAGAWRQVAGRQERKSEWRKGPALTSLRGEEFREVTSILIRGRHKPLSTERSLALPAWRMDVSRTTLEVRRGRGPGERCWQSGQGRRARGSAASGFGWGSSSAGEHHNFRTR